MRIRTIGPNVPETFPELCETAAFGQLDLDPHSRDPGGSRAVRSGVVGIVGGLSGTLLLSVWLLTGTARWTEAVR